MIQFLIGAVAGGVAAWHWRDDIRRYMDQKLPDVRSRAADRLQSFERTADNALDRARTRLSENLRAGQRVIRPRPASVTAIPRDDNTQREQR
jgi:hypothetical protein